MEEKKALCEQLAVQIGAGTSKYVPGIFDALVDADEAKLLLAAAPPATIEQLAETYGLDVRPDAPLFFWPSPLPLARKPYREGS